MTSSHTVVNTASQDSAAESLDTLTVQWSTTEQRVKSIVEDNTKLQQENKTLLQQLQEKTDKNTTTLTTTVTQLQSQIAGINGSSAPENSSTELAQPIQTVPELAESLHANSPSPKLEKNTSGNDQSHTVLIAKTCLHHSRQCHCGTKPVDDGIGGAHSRERCGDRSLSF